MMKGLSYLNEGNWEDIGAVWLKSEMKVGWEKLEGGLEGHIARRRAFFEKIKADQRLWRVYEITDPKIIPDFLIGPYPGWHAIFETPQTEECEKQPIVPINQRTFGEAIKVRRLITRVGEIMKNFPSEVQWVGGYVPEASDGWGRPFLFDGSHRAEAAARKLAAGHLIAAGTRHTIALTPFTEPERASLYERIHTA